MTQMLRHKETGELFIYTPALATLSELELVVEDPVAKVLAEIKAEEKVAPEPEVVEPSPLDELEAALGDTFDAPAPAPAPKKKQNRFGK